MNKHRLSFPRSFSDFRIAMFFNIFRFPFVKASKFGSGVAINPQQLVQFCMEG